MKEALAKEITSKQYGMAPDGDGSTPGTKLFLLRGIVSKYREAGYKALIKAYPKEIGDPIARRSIAAKEAWKQAVEKKGTPQSQLGKLHDFAAGYGIQLPIGR
jgi:hypothetical protein